MPNYFKPIGLFFLLAAMAIMTKLGFELLGTWLAWGDGDWIAVLLIGTLLASFVVVYLIKQAEEDS